MNCALASVEPTPTYPSGDAADVALRDGSTVHIRPVRIEDRSAIDVFLHRLSPQSIGFRFFGQIDLHWVLEWAMQVDYVDRYAFVACNGPSGEIVAHGAYIRCSSDAAEVAFVVADEWQDHGIATILLAHLAAAAERQGISSFTAEVLPANHRMIDVFRDSGFPITQRTGDGVIEIELPTSFAT
jgi:GNAT superfamily N-acetyltransferase